MHDKCDWQPSMSLILGFMYVGKHDNETLDAVLFEQFILINLGTDAGRNKLA